MPGFFNQQSLTERSLHLVDWSRVASLVRSGTHRYSVKELAVRGFVVGTMAAGTYLGYQKSDEQAGYGMKGFYSMSGCFVGFFLSHIVVVLPLLSKRLSMRKDCLEAKEKILVSISHLTGNQEEIELKEKIEGFVDHVMTLSLGNEKEAKASQTWGRRRRILSCLVDFLEEGKGVDDLRAFCEGSHDAMVEHLLNPVPAAQRP